MDACLTTTTWTVYVNGGLTAKVSGTATGMTSAWTWWTINGDYGKRDLPHPGPEARRKARQLLRLQGARNRRRNDARIAPPGDETAAIKAGEEH